MDYLKHISKIISFFSLLVFLSACDTEVSPEPLKITGNPPNQLYYGSPYEYTFGATGGDGVYRYRYIQNPSIEDDDELTENPVEMSIEVLDSAKPQFKLRALPKLPDDADLSTIGSQKHRYQIELTDGVNKIYSTYEFTLNKNRLKFSNNPPPPVREGLVTNIAATSLQKQLGTSRASICSDVANKSFEKHLTPYGYAYPYVFQVSIDSPLNERTELFYRFVSKYNDNESERSSQNIEAARKNVDYIDAVRSIILEPGETTCVGYIDLLDDISIESNEFVGIEFFDHIGGNLDYSDTHFDLEIFENEIIPRYISKQIVRNPGDIISIPLTLNRPVDHPVTINILFDQEKTTALASDFSIEPPSGVVTFEPGVLQSSFSINLANNIDASETTFDKLIQFKTDIDEVLDAEPYKIEINQWFKPNELAFEKVGNSKYGEQQVIDFIVDTEGSITTLSRQNQNGNQVAILESFSKTSEKINFAGKPAYIITKSGEDLNPVALVSDNSNQTNLIALILEVNSLFADTYRGLKDFVVMTFQKNSNGQFELLTSKQFGTEGIDNVTGAYLKNNTLYVYGNTNGEDFEGLPTNETNQGNFDGFIYAINIDTNEYKWSRLLGSSDFDNVKDIDVSNRELVALISKRNSDEDITVHKITSEDGQDIQNLSSLTVASSRDDTPASIKYDSSASKVLLLAHSDADLKSTESLTPSLSKDVQLLEIDSKNEVSGNRFFDTDQLDEATSLEISPNKLKVFVGGNTAGQFKDNIKRGENGSDNFITILDNVSNSLQFVSTLQFGTPANDQLISIKPVSDTKLFALWREEFTEPNNSVYRISAFSIDGKKLSSDPE